MNDLFQNEQVGTDEQSVIQEPVQVPTPAPRRSQRNKRPPDKYASGEFIMAQRTSHVNTDWKEKLEALNQLVILNPMHEGFIQQVHQKMLEVIN